MADREVHGTKQMQMEKFCGSPMLSSGASKKMMINKSSFFVKYIFTQVLVSDTPAPTVRKRTLSRDPFPLKTRTYFMDDHKEINSDTQDLVCQSFRN